MDPIKYVPCIKTLTDSCLLEQGAFTKVGEEENDSELTLMMLSWFSWAPATLLFGPLWKIVFPDDWATETLDKIRGRGTCPHDNRFLIRSTLLKGHADVQGTD